MSKRICISLSHAPRRAHYPFPQCALQPHPHNRPNGHNHNQHHPRHQPFSSTPLRPARGTITPSRQVSNPKQSQASIALAQKAQMESAQRSGSLLEHLGLQDAFVPPTAPPLLPSLLAEPRRRLALEYERFKSHLVTYVVSRIWIWKNSLPSDGLKTTPKIAVAIYKKMYESLARGDLSSLEGEVSPGMLGNLRSRIVNRLSSDSFEWNLHKHLSPPHLISYVAVVLPKPKGSASVSWFKPEHDSTAILQAVIKLRTRQSLLKLGKKRHADPRGRVSTREVVVDEHGNEIEEDWVERYRLSKAKDLTEYVVLQRFVKNGKVEDWHLYGMTEEITVEKLRQRRKEMADMQMAQMKKGTALA